MSSDDHRQRLEALGWTSDLDPHLEPDTTPARVSARHRVAVELFGPEGALTAPLPDLKALDPDPIDPTPQVGDWVLVDQAGAGPRITARLPRRSTLARKGAGRQTRAQVVAVNIDLVFVVTSMNADFSPRRLERYLTALYGAGVAPVVVLSKADLAYDRVHHFRREAELVSPGVPVLVTSALLDEGMQALEEQLAPGRTVGFIGSSGVGKSSLVNALIGEEAMRVEAIRASDETGQHTTTHRQLLELPGGRGMLLDTPGMREFQPWSSAGLDEAFADVDALAEGCRYRDCAHEGEPGCAVEEAIARGELSEERLRSWGKLKREAERLEAAKPAWEHRRERRRWTAMVREVQSHKQRWRD